MKASVNCLDAETLAAMADGRLPRSDVRRVLAHIDTCPSCTATLQAANDYASSHTTEHTFRAWRPALAAAALIAAILAALPFVLPRLRDRKGDDAISRLVQLAPRSERHIETRVSGGFAWAPYRAKERAADDTTDARRLRLNGVAGEAVEAADTHPSGTTQHDAGVALLMAENPAAALPRLQDATRRDPNDAHAWSDLAAAQYMVALRFDRPSLYPEALASADRALRADPAFAEALFNRALVLERIGLSEQARQAWSLYLAKDASSPWAAEAREHLQRLPASTHEELFRREQPAFENAVLANDTAAVTAFVNRYRRQSRGYAEAESLGRWGDAVSKDDAASAENNLRIARATGDALLALSGESLLHNAVAAIDRASATQRASIAEAHRLYRAGRVGFSRRELTTAEPALRKSATLFASAADPMAYVARYYAANVAFDRGATKEACPQLQALLAEAPSGAISLRAQIEWELSLCSMTEGDWEGALPHVQNARAGFDRLGERSNVAFLDGLLADALIALGRADESWTARIRAFTIESEERRGDRLSVSIDGAARMELQGGRAAAAHALIVVAESINRTAQNDVLLADSLVREALLEQELGDAASASTKAAEAAAVAHRIADPAMRTRALVDADFASGALLVSSDPRRAIDILGRAIDGYHSIERPVFVPACHLLRARAERNAGDDEAAAADLDRGIAALDLHRVHFASRIVGSDLFDPTTALFQEAIRLRLDRGAIAEALAYAERSRAKIVEAPEAFSVAALQRRLAGTGTAVLELVLLPGEVDGFLIDERGVSVQRLPVSNETLQSLTNRVANEDDDQAARTLYDFLLRPHATELARASRLIVIADRAIGDIPFAALQDRTTGERLVERVAIAMACDAASLRTDGRRTSTSRVVTVSLPATGANALPDLDREVSEIAAIYRQSRKLTEEQATFEAVVGAAKDADVVHIAGHTERQPGAGEPALMFAHQRISWRAAADAALDPHTVVALAACETLRAPQAAQTFSLSLGDGFLAAGAGDVIGTLYPIPDNEARTLFDAVHRELAANASAADAVRRAQLKTLAAGGRTRAWRALALLTRHTGN